MSIAETVSKRSTCDRLHVGCVLVKDRQILSAGYNGSMPGALHCDEDGHLMDESGHHCLRTIHAEANAIIAAAKNGVSIGGATAYVNWEPCFNCVKMLVTAGIKEIKFKNYYEPDPEKRFWLGGPMDVRFSNKITMDQLFSIYVTHIGQFWKKI